MANPHLALAMPPEVEALVREAQAKERTGGFDAARERYEAALRLLAGHDAAPAFASSLVRWIGRSHRAEGDGDAAMDCYIASLAIAELQGDRTNIAHALNSMGILDRDRGRLDRALERFDAARRIAEAEGDLRLVAMVEQNMGVIANIQGDLPRARSHYRRSLEGYRAAGEEAFLGSLLNNLGMLHTDLGEWEEAEQVLGEAAAHCERMGDAATWVRVEINRAELCVHTGDLARAREYCDSAFELANRLGQRTAMPEIYKWYGIIFRETGKFNLAETHLRQASELAERLVDPLLTAEVKRELAWVYRAQDRNREALQALTHARRVFEELRAERELDEVERRIREIEELYFQIVRKWGESIESKDRYTAGHCQRVADYSCMLARGLGFDERTLIWFRMGAVLHDVGKTIVPESILNKPGPLTPEEWEIMRRHTIAGVELLSDIDFPWDIRPMVRSHHEHWDGGGYPDGLKGEEIPLAARILCVADVFDALTTARSYRSAYTVEEALEIMARDAGRIFDPALFEAFRRLIQERLGAGEVVLR